MVDILISGGVVVTMDPERRIVEDGGVAIEGDRVVDVGPSSELKRRYSADRVIDATRKIVMPGLIDGHGHAGHGLIKNIASHDLDAWFKFCERVYAEGSTEEFWHAEALLTSLERLKFGTTCGVTFLGGGDSIMRTDDPAFGSRHCEAVKEVGIREFLAVGPRRPPFPRIFARWRGGSRRDVSVSFEDQLRTSETLIRTWDKGAHGKIRLGAMLPVFHPEDEGRTGLRMLKDMASSVRELTKKHGVLFFQDGHTRGTVKFAHEALGILGPDALLSHSTDLTDEEIGICRSTDSKVVHNPSAWASILGRCPVPELLDAGVTVMLGSDAAAPDRGFDMFRHMFQCMHYHRTHYRDPRYLPPGKVLEMATIDAARALGLEREIGSLEPGKKADIILVDALKPHLYPFKMLVHRVTCYANGGDVDTVIVDGEVLMEGRVVKTVDEAEVLDIAQRETEAMLDRTGLWDALRLPATFWGHSRY